MLRSQKGTPLAPGFEADGTALRLEAKMVHAALEHFEFGISQLGGKEVGGLGRRDFSGRLAHRGMLFERLMMLSTFSGKLW